MADMAHVAGLVLLLPILIILILINLILILVPIPTLPLPRWLLARRPPPSSTVTS